MIHPKDLNEDLAATELELWKTYLEMEELREKYSFAEAKWAYIRRHFAEIRIKQSEIAKEPTGAAGGNRQEPQK